MDIKHCNQWPITQRLSKHQHATCGRERSCFRSAWVAAALAQVCFLLWSKVTLVHLVSGSSLQSPACYRTCNHLMFSCKLLCIQRRCQRLPACPRARRELHKHFQVLTCVWTENSRFVSTSFAPSSLPSSILCSPAHLWLRRWSQHLYVYFLQPQPAALPWRVLRLLMGSSGNLAAVYPASPAAQRINGCSVVSLLCCLHQTSEYICRPTLKQSVDECMVGKAAVLHNSKCKYFGFKTNRRKMNLWKRRWGSFLP